MSDNNSIDESDTVADLIEQHILIGSLNVAAPISVATAKPSLLEKDEITAGSWRCHTEDSNGIESSDKYRFNDDGTFVSTSENVRVSGRFERSGIFLKLHFKRIIERGASR